MSETSETSETVRSTASSVAHATVKQHAIDTRELPWYRTRSFLIVFAAILLLAASWSYALLRSEAQQTLDQRVYAVASQLKCPICQGESVADSPSGLAQEMRGLIRQQLQEGKSGQQIIQYFEESYGTQIVWSPPWQGFSLLVWLVPIALLLGGTILVFFVFRDWRLATIAPVSESDTTESDKTLRDDAGLELYRAQLEEELALDDPLFAHERKELR